MTEDHPQCMHEISDLEEKFKAWCEESRNKSSTADAYWSRIKDFPFFTLEKYTKPKIEGMLNKQIKTQAEKTAVFQYLEFLVEEYEVDNVSDEKYSELQDKKNSIQKNISLPKRERNKEKGVDVKKHYIHKQGLVKLIEKLEPRKARMVYLLYSMGARIGELRRVGPPHLREMYGRFGAIKIPEGRTAVGYKSKDERTVEFLSPVPIQIFEKVETGDWQDEDHNETWENVYFNDLYSQKLNYHINKHLEEIGLSRKTSHSFRHTRITDLVNNEEWAASEVQRRIGQQMGSPVINEYVETSFDRPPQTLENYTEEKNIDIREKIKA